MACTGTFYSTGDAKHVVDMRSDSVTLPTQQMRDAMRDAEVGNHSLGDDPTAAKLEATAAKMFGKEDAVFVPSCCMANLIAILCHCSERGSEMIVGDKSHLYLFEQGAAATIAGVHSLAMPTNADGTLNLADIEAAVRPDDAHVPVSKLVCLENTHNESGGAVLDTAYMDSVGKLAHKHGMALHVDGARIFNAATSLGVSVARLTRECDTVAFTVSKGLVAPIGAMIVGSKALMYKARRWRRGLGGAMSQVGVVAAPALLALTVMSKRVHEDHRRAKTVAEALAKMPGIQVNLARTQSNIVLFDVAGTGMTANEFAKRCAAKGIRVGAKVTGIRAVCHNGVDDAGIELAIQAFKDITEEAAASKGTTLTSRL